MIRALSTAASFLPALAHEATHFAAAKPWAEEAEMQVDIGGAAAVTRVRWGENAPRSIRVFAHLAPTVMGFGGGALVSLYWALNGFHLPESGDTWAKLALACIVWVLYAIPSPADIRGAIDQ